MKRFFTLIVVSAVLLAAGCGRRPPAALVIEGLDKPEEVLARYMAVEPEVVDVIGCFESYSQQSSSLLSSNGSLLMPWYTRDMRSGTLRLVGSDGEVDVDYSIASKSDRRWKVHKLKLASNQPDPIDP